MPTRDAVAFCTVLVRAFFGDNAALVATTLLNYGRSDCAGLARRCRLSPKLVKRCLAALMVHGLCRYGKFPSAHEEDQERVLYECSHEEIAALSQIGKAVLHTSRNLSVGSAAMAKHVLAQGQVRIKDLIQQFSVHGDAYSDEDEAFSATALEHRIIELLYERFFVYAQPSDALLKSERDRDLKARIKADAKKGLSEAKLKAHIDERLAAHESKRQQAEDEKLNALHRAAADVEALAKEGHSEPPRKKFRTDNGSASAAQVTLLDGDALVRFNHAKLGVLARTRDLVSLCTVTCGEEIAQVYGNLLDTLHRTTASCEERGKRRCNITERDIARAIPRDAFLEDSWCLPPQTNRAGRRGGSNAQRSSRHADMSEDNSDSDEILSDEARSENSEEDDDTGRAAPSIQSRRVLAVLTQSHIPFVTQLTKTHFKVDFDVLGEVLRDRQIEALVLQQLGPIAVRLLRVVKEKQKVDEKQVYTMALLPHKDIRQALTSLHQLGVLELQEVPKRLDRQPSLTLYFWFHKPDKAAMTLAGGLCQAMAKMHQRLEALLAEKARLLAKSKRTDVQQREAELMSAGELRDLRGVYAMQDRLLGQCARAYQAYQSLAHY